MNLEEKYEKLHKLIHQQGYNDLEKSKEKQRLADKLNISFSDGSNFKDLRFRVTDEDETFQEYLEQINFEELNANLELILEEFKIINKATQERYLENDRKLQMLINEFEKEKN